MKYYVANEIKGKLQGRMIIDKAAQTIGEACNNFGADEIIRIGERFSEMYFSGIYEVYAVVDGKNDYKEERIIHTTKYDKQ